MVALGTGLTPWCVKEELSGDTLNNVTPSAKESFFIFKKSVRFSAGLLYHLPRTLSTKTAAARKDFWLARARLPVHSEVKV